MNTPPAEIPPEGHFASINGMEMYYELHGDGSPLVLLHYFHGSTLSWQAYKNRLAEHFTLVVPDLRGHGRSTNPLNQFTYWQSALDIFALLDQLQIHQFKAIGVSAGGMTLLHMATQQPARLHAMVLVSATSYFPEECRTILRQVTPESAMYDWNDLRHQHVRGEDQIRALINQFRNQAASYDDMNFTPPYLSTITASTLIVHGDRDPFFPVSIPVGMYAAIPNSYLWIVPNGYHADFMVNRPELVTSPALDFLEGKWQQAPPES